jgi:hypothetical protein
MSQFALVFPMLALVVLTFGVSVKLFRARLRSVREGHTPVSYFRVFQGSPEPEFLAKPTRHYVNLFETPVLFYAGCLAAMVAGVTGPVPVALAWGYVAARLVHAWVHLGGNRVRHRLRAFLVGWLCLLGLWISVGVGVAVREDPSAARSLANLPDSASQLLEAYCSLDFDGARLNSSTGKQVWSMVAWEHEPGWDAVKLVEGFTLGAPKASGNRIEIPVIYEVVGTAVGPQVTRFGKELETVKFELESAGGSWKIVGPIIPPHVSLAAHERALASG